MTKIPNAPASLEDRTYAFAQDCKRLIKHLPKSITNIEYAKQLTRSSGSVAANYIEANEALSKKDFIMRCRISRKEVKESRLWLQLLDVKNDESENRQHMVQESTELLKIFSSIIEKVTQK